MGRWHLGFKEEDEEEEEEEEAMSLTEATGGDGRGLIHFVSIIRESVCVAEAPREPFLIYKRLESTWARALSGISSSPPPPHELKRKGQRQRKTDPRGYWCCWAVKKVCTLLLLDVRPSPHILTALDQNIQAC